MSQDEKSSSGIVGLLLAAGSSSRLGQPKQLLQFQGRPLVRHMAEQAIASRLGSLVVVVGARAPEVRAALDGLKVMIVENPDYLQGQSTSMKAGLVDLPRDARAVMILLVDQPFVDAHLIDRLIGLYEEASPLIVAPQHQGRRGNPVIFDHTLVPEMLTVVGDTGARDVIGRHRDRLATLELPDDKAFLDIDTWEDYQQVAEGPAISGAG